MATFNNLEGLGSIRTKLNTNILDTEKLIVKKNDVIAGADLASGTVTSKTANTITDNTKSYSTNQFANKGIMLITANGELDFGIIATNTATVLTLDANHANFAFATYRILSTFEIPTINSITGVTFTANDCAILLPALATTEDRKFVKVYAEQANNDGKLAAIICRNSDKQRGQKFGFLQNIYEGVEFWSHDFGVKHWDILALENVKRFISGTINTNTAVANTAYTVAFPFANITTATRKRFDPLNVSGGYWFQYKSITPLTMVMDGALIVTRSGGGSSLVEFAIRIKRFSTGVTEDSTNTIKARFSGDETKTIPITLPFDLQPYDEVTIIARRDAGTIVIEAGSNILIKEM
jgi:hypothetical protein